LLSALIIVFWGKDVKKSGIFPHFFLEDRKLISEDKKSTAQGATL
jgi:hypothetical protein